MELTFLAHFPMLKIIISEGSTKENRIMVDENFEQAAGVDF